MLAGRIYEDEAELKRLVSIEAFQTVLIFPLVFRQSGLNLYRHRSAIVRDAPQNTISNKPARIKLDLVLPILLLIIFFPSVMLRLS